MRKSQYLKTSHPRRQNSHLPSGHYPQKSGLEVYDRRRDRRVV